MKLVNAFGTYDFMSCDYWTVNTERLSVFCGGYYSERTSIKYKNCELENDGDCQWTFNNKIKKKLHVELNNIEEGKKIWKK